MGDSYGELRGRIEVLAKELVEAHEQQAAAGAILRVIAASPADIQPVLNAVAESAARLCNAFDATIYLLHGERLAVGAHHGPIPVSADGLPVMRDLVTGRAVLERVPVHVHDLRKAGDEFATGRSMAEQLGFHTILATPLLREGEAIGALMIRRTEMRPFTDKQIELLKTFADQAVIAIENVRLFEEIQARNREVTAAFEQQTATSEVLRVIAASPTDIQPVLQVVVESAARFCDTHDAGIFLAQDGMLIPKAHYGPIAFDFEPHPVTRDWVIGRAVLDCETVHVNDILAAGDEFPASRTLAQRIGHRTLLATPLIREKKAIGGLVIRRAEVRPFSGQQIELLKTFADQAVIAIENVRLFTELDETLQQQTETADVLKVISRSAFDLQAVLDTLVESATRTCKAENGAILHRRGELYHMAANHGFSPEFQDYARGHPLSVNMGSTTGRVALSGKTVHIADVLADPNYDAFGHQKRGDYRTSLGVPLLSKDEPVGVFVLTRPEVKPFTAKQIEMVETFADQAVIAIENLRLLTELEESLQQQTATADVLKVISRSAFNLHSVLQTLIASACNLCGSAEGGIYMLDNSGGGYRLGAHYGMTPEFFAFEAHHVNRVGRDSYVGRTALERAVVHVPDVSKDLEYGFPELPSLGGFKAVLSVPLMREGVPIGVFSMAKPEPGPYMPRQIELVQTFADQAVIAIENVRLFTELEEALQQQTATADVLKVISRSAFDLQAVLQTLIDSAVRLCGARTSGIFMRDGDFFRLGAGYSQTPEYDEYERSNPSPLSRKSWVGRCAIDKAILHVPDVSMDLEHGMPDAPRIGRYKAVLCVPLIREGTVIGVFAMTRPESGPFTERQIELVKTLADQAVIAIENVRLFREVKDRTEELSHSLENLRAAQDRLIQTEKLASLGQLTAGIAHEIKNPLNFVNNFAALSGALLTELSEVLDRTAQDGSGRREIDELMQMLKDNFDKVVHHGQRADSIVKNMLLHSRAGSGEHWPISINSVVEDSLNLAYHGARAETKDFNITLERSFDPDAGEVDLFPQEITRVLLNLISNSFYATRRRGAEANGPYEPVLKASTANLGDRVEIRIRDNGTGIPADVREKMFNPFFTTKPAGEGTGLGLSLSHDIVVKQHAGAITVETTPGEFTEFSIVLPRAAASLAKT